VGKGKKETEGTDGSRGGEARVTPTQRLNQSGEGNDIDTGTTEPCGGFGTPDEERSL